MACLRVKTLFRVRKGRCVQYCTKRHSRTADFGITNKAAKNIIKRQTDISRLARAAWLGKLEVRGKTDISRLARAARRGKSF